MNIYLLSQNYNNGYDTYDSAIVAAESEEDAKSVSIDEYAVDDIEYTKLIWVESQHIKVKYIGIADKSIMRGVICASFNAG